MNQHTHKPTAPYLTRHTGHSDIYTLLIVIAAVALLVGIGFVWYRSTALFDASNPFAVVSQSVPRWLSTLQR
jgi:hypothetical protein